MCRFRQDMYMENSTLKRKPPQRDESIEGVFNWLQITRIARWTPHYERGEILFL